MQRNTVACTCVSHGTDSGPCSRRSWCCRSRALKVLAIAAAIASLGIASCTETPDAGRVVAVVNGEPITRGELLDELQKKHGPRALLKLLDEALVAEAAAERGVTLTPAERDAGLERAAARVGSRIDLEERLKQKGIPMDAYRREIDTDLLMDKIAAQEVKVTDDEVRAYYAEHRAEFQRGVRVRARMMLFRDKGSAAAVLEALQSPEADFAGLAKALSEDDATRDSGGDMGYFEKQDYAAAISEAAFSLEPGSTSAVLEAPDGWVILRVEDRKPEGPLPLDEVKEQIRQRLERERRPEAREKWLLAARKAAELQIPRNELRQAVEAQIMQVDPPPMPGEL